MSSIQSPGRRSVTAFFDSKADADEAASRIRAEGVSDADIRIVAGESDVTGTEARTERKGFWESLSDFFLPNEDRYAYAEGLSRGGYFVSVATNDGNRARILDILDDEGTVDMDAREASWRSEGWAGYDAGRDDIGAEAFGRPASAAGGSVADAGGYGARDAAATGGATSGLGGSRDDTYDSQHPLVAGDGGRLAGTERFGRRDTSESRTRVRSYFSDDDDTFGRESSTVDQAQPVSDQVRQTDVELEYERPETAEDVARRTRGAI